MTAPYLLALSGRDPRELRAVVARDDLDLLEQATNPQDIADLCWKAIHQPQHRYRHTVVGSDRRQLTDGLRAFISQDSWVREADQTEVVFVFPGQGAQRAGTGRELMRTFPRFAEYLRECDEAVIAEAGWSVLDMLLTETALYGESQIQPTLWALQVSLARMWRGWGIEPHAVIGHSMGEVAAAVTTGALTVTEGAALVCRRGALLESVSDTGDMWAVQLDEHAAREAIGFFVDRVFVAAVNSDHFTTLSGDSAALAEVTTSLRERGVFCRKLKVGAAGHTPMMEPVLGRLREQLTDLAPRSAGIPIHSTVLDRIVRGDELTADYWAAHLREPVRFASACRAVMNEQRRTLFIEVGPQAALVASIEDNIVASGSDSAVLPSIRRDWSEAESLMTSLGLAYTWGCDPAWDRVYER